MGKLSVVMHFSMDVLYAPGSFDLKACLLHTWPGKEEMKDALINSKK